MKKKFRYIILIGYLLIAVILIYLSLNHDQKKIEVNNLNNSVLESQKNVTSNKVIKSELVSKPSVVKISAKIIIDKLILQPKFEPGKSLYDILIMEKENDKLNFVGKNFSGMGFFVSSIGDLKEADNKHLIYFVNGKSPNIGISNYILKDKDVVEWQLK